MDNSYYLTRLQSIVSTISESTDVRVFGPVTEAVLAALRKYGLRVYVDSKPNPDDTVVLFDHATNLSSEIIRDFFGHVADARNIIVFGRNHAAKPVIENVAFELGYRIHPAYFAHVDYDDEFHDGYWSILQRLAVPAFEKYDMNWLLRDRNLHMDMTRECGRRSDAHMIRYVYASRFIRPGDTVLDCASGLGYGSNIMRTVSDCGKVLGRDLSERAVQYARDNFVQSGLSYEVGDAQDLASHESDSIDTFVSFETLEHVPEPEKVISEAWRVLKPGGRFIASVPYDWSDETGQDPNPFHLHVYTKRKFVEQVSERFRIEELCVQNAGGGYKLPKAQKAIFTVDPHGDEEAGEWLLVVAYKDPLSVSSSEFRDTIYPYPNPTVNFLSFERDYLYPGLMRSLFGIGVRISNARQRDLIANQVMDLVPQGSADAGAALCVIGYRLLDKGTDEELCGYLAKTELYIASDPETPHARRWVISLSFVNALVYQRLGNNVAAMLSFDAVIDSDWLSFSPTLGTKATEAAYRAGMLKYQEQDLKAARLYWSKGMSVARRIMSAEWHEISGNDDCPLPDAMRETVQALDIARRCGDCLRMTSGAEYRSSYAKWRSMVADPSMVACRDLAIAQKAETALQDAQKWRRLRSKIHSIRSLSVILKLFRKIRRGMGR